MLQCADYYSEEEVDGSMCEKLTSDSPTPPPPQPPLHRYFKKQRRRYITWCEAGPPAPDERPDLHVRKPTDWNFNYVSCRCTKVSR
ncbi:hypothetical protein INR49_017156 [Caranx melampygus]|nr:hypothetical protein INR49_017156 [Caranx melampygus]